MSENITDQANTSQSVSLNELLKQFWWVMFLRGLALCIIGVFLIARPGTTIQVLAQVIGIFLILEGSLAIAMALMVQLPSRGWIIVRGIIAILIGIFVFAQPALVAGITATVLLTILAIGVIAMGILELVAALKERDDSTGGPSPSMFSAILSLVLGIMILLAPLTFGKVILMILGVFALFSGVAHFAIAGRIRKARKAT